MGEVYKATDTRLGRTVAIKVLPAHVAGDPALRARLEREAKAISSLNHPHICTLHDIGHQDGTDFLVMEYLEGETLASRLTQGALPLSGRHALRRRPRRQAPRYRSRRSRTGAGQREQHIILYGGAEFRIRACNGRQQVTPP
jgi:hypothetical protein